jgi:ribonuclease P protein component
MGRFGPERRVRKRAEFQRIQRAGRRATSRHFVVLVLARAPADAGPTRLGLTVSRRVGNAVRRSRAKRLIREAFRHCPGWWFQDVDLVVIAKPLPPSLGQPELVAEFEQLTPKLARVVEQARKDLKNRDS